MDQRREPILNVPAVVVLVLVAIGVIHALRVFVFTEDFDRLVIFTFGFVPARYDLNGLNGILPGGFGADVWTFVTYGFLHADLMHLGFNALWLLAFASPVARRFGLAYAMFILINILPPLAAGGVLSAGRFSSVLFPAFIWAAAVIRPAQRPAWLSAFMAIQGLNAVLFYTWREMF